MRQWLDSLQRVFEDPSRNATAAAAAIAIVVIAVVLVVLILIAFALPKAAPRPKRDGSIARLPRWAALATGVVLVIVGLTGATALWYHATSSNVYCTRTCHSMATANETWTLSSHSRIACTRCHEGRKWESFTKGVTSRAYSVYLEISGDTPRGTTVPPAICLSCHESFIDREIIARNGEPFSHREALAANEDCVRCHGAQGHQARRP